MKAPRLPESGKLPIEPLKRLFAKHTNSYKFMFFLALLDRLDAGDGPAIRFVDLAQDILTRAWYPHTAFKLSFGRQDMLGRHLDEILHEAPELESLAGKLLTPAVRKAVRDRIGDLLVHDGAPTPRVRQMMRYVPTRLLTPFFEEQLKGLADQRKDLEIRSLADAAFASERPAPYRLERAREGEFLLLHDHWFAYLERHGKILRGWAMWHLVEFLTQRNPDMSGIARKIEPPLKRASLQAQRKYWDRALAGGARLRCIYTGQPMPKPSAGGGHSTTSCPGPGSRMTICGT